MKKNLKICVFITLFLAIFVTSVNSSSISMDLEYYDQSNTNIQSENYIYDNDLNNPVENRNGNHNHNNFLNEETNNLETENEYIPIITSPATTSDDDKFLTVENILSIIIIVIGVLLIFLAVAILIRFK